MTGLVSSANVLAQLPAIVFILRYRISTDDFHAEFVSNGTELDLDTQNLNGTLSADRTQLRATAAALQVRLREIAELKGAVQEISHREQERIGHDIHDGPGRELAAIVLLLENLERKMCDQPADLVSAVTAIRELAYQSAQHMRAMAGALSPVYGDHVDRSGISLAAADRV